jgi:hypothetical protein
VTTHCTPGQLNFAAHSRKTARPRDRKYRSVWWTVSPPTKIADQNGGYLKSSADNAW